MEEWVQLSHKIAALFPANTPEPHGILITLQQLARFEHEIDEMEETYRTKRRQKEPEQPWEFDRLVTYAYLWVLGAYELTRALAQKTGNKDLIETKEKFARLRMPLAKPEASKKHADTDYAFPLPAINKDTLEPGWTLNPSLVVTRKELSDALIGSLKKVKGYQY